MSATTDQFEDAGRLLAVVRAPLNQPQPVYHAGPLPEARRQAYLALGQALQQACAPILHVATLQTMRDQLFFMGESREGAGEEANDHIDRLWALYEQERAAALPQVLTRREQRAQRCIAEIAALTAPLQVHLEGWDHYCDDYSEHYHSFAVLSPAATPEEQAAVDELIGEYQQMLHIMGEDPHPLAVYLLSDRTERALYRHAERVTPRVVSLCRRALHDLVLLSTGDDWVSGLPGSPGL
ncbi:hypothetical protein K7W42_13035 [Deinococcus sp. HMF7604]|uniref:hypothetical protein n=1 Tax=Deinococcus betulae TaxID=2873312 RepID=UPI001CCC22EA|nr:hypothetical protein [Deinococcus betulae]MBZ9751782.1 hypothetical protein [Deinococcus betulae]